jgi:pimeloyl-ACP methyl ester carboxylesterase
MRAREPEVTGFVERDGVKTSYEVFGDGDPTVLFLPPWQIVHSRIFKAQIPDAARRFRAVTFDVRGSGRSDRPEGAEHYADIEVVEDAVAVLDAVGADRAVVVGVSLSGWWAPLMAAEYPDRVSGIVVVGPVSPLGTFPVPDLTQPLDTDEGWAKFNHHYWRRDYRGFLEFFFAQLFTEPHSTKQIEDGISWGLENTPETLIDTNPAPSRFWGKADDVYARVRCPALVLHGEADLIRPLGQGEALARATGGRLVTFEGRGHSPHARYPVKVNLLIREFIDSVLADEPLAARVAG